jgi:hypothetical protein
MLKIQREENPFPDICLEVTSEADRLEEMWRFVKRNPDLRLGLRTSETRVQMK